MSGYANIDELTKTNEAVAKAMDHVRQMVTVGGMSPDCIATLKVVGPALHAIVRLIEARDRAFTAALNMHEKMLIDADLIEAPKLDG